MIETILCGSREGICQIKKIFRIIFKKIWTNEYNLTNFQIEPALLIKIY